MILRVQSPTMVVFEGEVIKVTAEALDGFYTFLSRHIDFVTALVPGLLTMVRPDGREEFLAVDEGALVKQGQRILVSAFSALRGPDLGTLREAVEREFLELAGHEEDARRALTELEADLVRRYVEFERD